MKKQEEAQKEVLLFLYNLASTIHKQPEKVSELPEIFKEYISKGRLPLITLDNVSYYNEIANEKLPKLQKTEPTLYATLADLLKTHPPLKGGISGDHVNYDMVSHNEDTTALIGRFIDCWEITA